MTLSKPTAVIFDWDNTLVNTWPIIHEALNATFQQMQKPLWTFEQTKARVRKSMRDSFPEIFGPKWQDAGALYQAEYRKLHLDMLEALPDATDTLELVRKKNLYCVVVSNKKGNNLRQEIAHLGWGHYFDSVVGADDAARDKPHTDPVILAFQKTHIKPGPDVWFVGDSAIDLECAEACGCTGILYGEIADDYPGHTPTHHEGFAYHAHVKNHREAAALLTGA